eukprot:gene9200-10174_t
MIPSERSFGNKESDAYPRANSKKRCIDPLTGRKIHLALQNGFSKFVTEDSRLEETNFTVVKSRAESTNRNFRDAGRSECAGGHYTDLTLRCFKSERIGKSLLKRPPAETLCIDSHMKNFVKSWNNPVLGVSADKCLDAQLNGYLKPKQRKTISKNVMSGISLHKSLIKRFVVLGQVDRKFIACKCIVKRQNSSELSESENNTSYLFLIDQHAAHERVRLENLQKEFKKLTNNQNIVVPKTLRPAITMDLSLALEQSLKSHKKEFLKIGIDYTIQNELIIDDKNHVTILLKTLPKLFVKAGELCDKPILELSSLKELFHEHLKWLGSTSSMTNYLIPPSINTVLCSYSCHGAIRFGDVLTVAECEAIIQMLATCKLPFQCAHGRPSIAPLVNLGSIEIANCSSKLKKPRLWKLRKSDF